MFIISTVRTLHTCKTMASCANETTQKPYYEFLSDPKLLNTAITRAQSLVAVVGDPLSLCTMGDCSYLWKEFIDKCDKGEGLFGFRKEYLEYDIAKHFETSKHELNVEAEEFVPSWLSFETSKANAENAEDNGSQDGKENNTHLANQGGALLVDQTKNDNNAQDHLKNSNSPMTSKHGEVQLVDQRNKHFLNETQTCNASTSDDTEGLQRNDERLYKLLLDDDKHPKVFDKLMRALAALVADIPEQGTTSEIKDSSREQPDVMHQDVEVVTKRKKLEIEIVNCLYHNQKYTERTERLINVRSDNFRLQENLVPEYLLDRLVKEPKKYKRCILRSTYVRFRKTFGEVQDTTTNDIKITGRVRQVLDGDVVVVELNEHQVPIDSALQREPCVETNLAPQRTAKLVGMYLVPLTYRFRRRRLSFTVPNFFCILNL